VADALLQRLILKPAKISQLAAGIRAIADQPEPIGQLVRRMEVAEGKLSIPGSITWHRAGKGYTGRLYADVLEVWVEARIHQFQPC
jgi:hypothetical protein